MDPSTEMQEAEDAEVQYFIFKKNKENLHNTMMQTGKNLPNKKIWPNWEPDLCS